MSAADTLARPPVKEEPPRDQIDRDYNAASWPDGYAPSLERKKEYPEVLTVPPVVLGCVDRGKRVHGAALVDEKGDGDSDQEEQAIESPERLDDETERAIKVAGEVLDRKLVRFLIQGKRGARIAARLAAIGILSRNFRPKDLYKHFDEREVTPARLRLATAELQELLEADEKGGAS